MLRYAVSQREGTLLPEDTGQCCCQKIDAEGLPAEGVTHLIQVLGALPNPGHNSQPRRKAATDALSWQDLSRQSSGRRAPA